MAMEGAFALRSTLEANCQATFDPIALRKALKEGHVQQQDRLVSLLRATELVQALGQPPTGGFGGFVSRRVMRPMMYISPDFIKRPIFNAMLKYSLGV
mmetsp:Transcript_29387/g.68016  ORF Transcript_29387/g.68016 Transcript_29387/m.68016 type:complete len:98 (+) Transcript_29387:78-371(+)